MYVTSFSDFKNGFHYTVSWRCRRCSPYQANSGNTKQDWCLWAPPVRSRWRSSCAVRPSPSQAKFTQIPRPHCTRCSTWRKEFSVPSLCRCGGVLGRTAWAVYLRVNDEFHLLNISDILYRPLRIGVRTISFSLTYCNKRFHVSKQVRPDWPSSMLQGSECPV